MVLCISIQVPVITIGIIIYKELKKKNSLEEKRLLYELQSNEDENFELLDKMITDAVAQYQVIKFGTDQDLYINEKEQKAMLNKVLKDVLEKISPIYYQKLILIYNENKLEDIIFQKVSMAVFSYAISVNGSYNE